jgi:hypothetical protein
MRSFVKKPTSGWELSPAAAMLEMQAAITSSRQIVLLMVYYREGQNPQNSATAEQLCSCCKGAAPFIAE